MSITISVPPTEEPITIDYVQQWTGLNDSEHDDRIFELISSAREHIGGRVKRSLMPQTIIDRRDCFPPWLIELSLPPVQSVTSIEYIDAAGDPQTVSSGDYVTDLSSLPARIMPIKNTSWPTTDSVMNAVTITYVAGYTDAGAIPAKLRNAIAMMVDHWAEHTSPVSELRLMDTPLSVEAMIAEYIIY